MTTVLASQGLNHKYFYPLENGRASLDLRFHGSLSSLQQLKCNVLSSKFLYMTKYLRTEACQQESSKFGTNGRASRMVSTKDLVKTKLALQNKTEIVNGNINVASVLSGSKTPKNGAGLVKSNDTVYLNNLRKKQVADDLSFVELKVLPSDENFKWASENYNAWQRTIDIWSFVLSLRVRVLFDNAKWAYLDGFTENKQAKRRQRTASWCREKVLQLGPTFIKLGQLSSTRSDLFPKEFVDELAKLQDRVPAFSPEKAKTFIENELGASVNTLFRHFEDRPIAAASLGQVHCAILHNGEIVAVKVQRPGLKRLFDIDLRNLKLIAEYFQQSESLGGPSRDWIGIYDECCKILYQEIDYINEGRNADRFRQDFRNVKWVRVPTVLWDYTSTKVLTLEYVPGIKINSISELQARGNNCSQIASRAIEAYLIQILKTGFFHADPHPGNLAIDRDGSIIYYDFGMMGEIKSFTRERLLNLFYSVYEKDANKVMKYLIEVEALKPTGDMSSVKRSVQFFLDNLLSQSPDQQQTLAAIGEDLFAIAIDQPFRFPSTFTFVIRAFTTLEGIGYTLDPKFSFLKVAAPYAQELLDLRQKQQTGVELVNEIRRQANVANYEVLTPLFYKPKGKDNSETTVGDYDDMVHETMGRPRSSRGSLIRDSRQYGHDKCYESSQCGPIAVIGSAARDSTISMPYRIQKIEEFINQLESGDLKLRVRVLESERAARKVGVLQMATIYTALGGTLLNVGITLSSQGNQAIAAGAFIGAGVFSAALIRSMQRVKKLDKFEKML